MEGKEIIPCEICFEDKEYELMKQCCEWQFHRRPNLAKVNARLMEMFKYPGKYLYFRKCMLLPCYRLKLMYTFTFTNAKRSQGWTAQVTIPESKNGIGLVSLGKTSPWLWCIVIVYSQFLFSLIGGNWKWDGKIYSKK